jgi:hypothetical protein
MSNENYAETIARMKAEAQQREMNQNLREAAAVYEEVQENERLAAEALAAGDQDSANFYVEQLAEKERELGYYAEKLPPPPPEVDPRIAKGYQRNRAYFDRYGNRGWEVFAAAYGHLTRPKNPNSTDWRQSGMGLTPDQALSPAGQRLMEDWAEVNGKPLFNVQYDPNEKALGPNQAAKISGLSPQQYNYAAKVLWQQGRVGGKR